MPRAGGLWTSFCNCALDAVYPAKCALCGLFAERSVCAACLDGFVCVDPQLDRRSGETVLDYRAVLYRYEERAAQAVRRLKYSRATTLAGFMSAEVRLGYDRLSLEPDLVVPVPIHWSRRCNRGFNQAELLCDDLPWVRGALVRVRRTRPQVGLSREERARNLDGAFLAMPVVSGQRVLLVDDVLTSGQTARECAKALRAAGAVEVGILAFCGEV
jgi:ComF family protein